jgi:hypothetical protein
MGTLIIRQPDGRYAEFSTIVDEFVGWDLDRHDLWSDLRYDAVRAAADELPSRLERTDERGTSSSPSSSPSGTRSTAPTG